MDQPGVSKNFALTLFSWCAIGASVSLIFWVMWSLLYPFHVLDVQEGSWTIANPDKRIRRGEPIQVNIDYCLRTDKAPRMDMLIEQDNRVIFLETRYPPVDPGCHKVTVPLVNIPTVLPIESTTEGGTGAARLRVMVTYPINALRDVQYTFQTDSFVIDP